MEALLDSPMILVELMAAPLPRGTGALDLPTSRSHHTAAPPYS